MSLFGLLQDRRYDTLATWAERVQDDSRSTKKSPKGREMQHNAFSRRDLIRWACAASGGLTALSAEIECCAAADRKPLKLAFHMGMFGRRQGPAAFQQIREAGFRYVELGGAQIRTASRSAQSAEQLQRQLADAGLTAVSAFIVIRDIASNDETRRNRGLDQWRRSIESAARLGLQHVGTELTGDVRDPRSGEVSFRKSLGELLPALEQSNLHLALEPHPGDFFEAAVPTIELARSYRSKHVGYLHCTPHTFYLGPSARRVIEAAGDMLSHVHIADTFRTHRIMDRFQTGVGLHLHLVPGLGEVDFEQTFAALDAVGYGGAVSVQALSYSDDPLEAARRSRKYLIQLLGPERVS